MRCRATRGTFVRSGGGRRQDGAAYGNDPQHDRPPGRCQHLLRHRRTLPRRRGALPRHESRRGVAEHGDGLRADERTAGLPVPRGPGRADHGRILSGRRAPRCAAAHRQYLPVHPGRHGSVWPDGANALAPGVSAHPGHRTLAAGGAHRQYRHWRHHFHSGGVCACGRSDRPCGGAYVFASFGAHRALSQEGE